MLPKPLCILASAVFLGGCGRAYHLPGHHEANLNHPPDITLEQGDRVRAISTGLYFHPTYAPAAMDSNDSAVVEVGMPPERNSGTAYLIAKQPGTATVRYGMFSDRDAANVGFTVTVVEK